MGESLDNPIHSLLDFGNSSGSTDLLLFTQPDYGRTLSGLLACVNLIEDQCGGSKCRSNGRSLARQPLRLHAGGDSGNLIRLRFILNRYGKAEIYNAPPAMTVQHDIFRFEIVMQHSLLIRYSQPRYELPGDDQGFSVGPMPDTLKLQTPVLAVDVLHRNKMPLINLTDVMDMADF